MKASLLVYRVMAIIISCFLIVLICIGVPIRYLAASGTSLQSFGYNLTEIVGVIHGFMYMGFLVVAANLARRARFPILFAIMVLALGTVPFFSFLAEHLATKRVLAEYPELALRRSLREAAYEDEDEDEEVVDGMPATGAAPVD